MRLKNQNKNMIYLLTIVITTNLAALGFICTKLGSIHNDNAVLCTQIVELKTQIGILSTVTNKLQPLKSKVDAFKNSRDELLIKSVEGSPMLDLSAGLKSNASYLEFLLGYAPSFNSVLYTSALLGLSFVIFYTAKTAIVATGDWQLLLLIDGTFRKTATYGQSWLKYFDKTTPPVLPDIREHIAGINDTLITALQKRTENVTESLAKNSAEIDPIAINSLINGFSDEAVQAVCSMLPKSELIVPLEILQNTVVIQSTYSGGLVPKFGHSISIMDGVSDAAVLADSTAEVLKNMSPFF